MHAVEELVVDGAVKDEEEIEQKKNESTKNMESTNTTLAESPSVTHLVSSSPPPPAHPTLAPPDALHTDAHPHPTPTPLDAPTHASPSASTQLAEPPSSSSQALEAEAPPPAPTDQAPPAPAPALLLESESTPPHSTDERVQRWLAHQRVSLSLPASLTLADALDEQLREVEVAEELGVREEVEVVGVQAEVDADVGVDDVEAAAEEGEGEELATEGEEAEEPLDAWNPTHPVPPLVSSARHVASTPSSISPSPALPHLHLQNLHLHTLARDGADSPLLGFPSSESLLLPLTTQLQAGGMGAEEGMDLPPAIGRGMSGCWGVYGVPEEFEKAKIGEERGLEESIGEKMMNGLGFEDEERGVKEKRVDESAEEQTEEPIPIDPLLRPARYYVRALPEGVEAAPEAEDVVVESVEGDRVEEALEYTLDAGLVVDEAVEKVVEDRLGRDKPLPTLPPPSPEPAPLLPAAPLPTVSATSPSTSPSPSRSTSPLTLRRAPSQSLSLSHTLSQSQGQIQTQSRRTSAASRLAPSSPSSNSNSNSLSASSPNLLSKSPSTSPSATHYVPGLALPLAQSASYTSGMQGVQTSARHALFAIGPGPGPTTTSTKTRRGSQASILGVGGIGGQGGLGWRTSAASGVGVVEVPKDVEEWHETREGRQETRELGGGREDTTHEPPQYHLPLAMQVKRKMSAALLSANINASATTSAVQSPSASPRQAEAAMATAAGAGLERTMSSSSTSLTSSLSSLSLLQAPVQAHAYQPIGQPAGVVSSNAPQVQSLNASPTVPELTRSPSLVHSPSMAPLPPSPIAQASPLPRSAPPTRRSRAGSLGATMSLSLTSLASLSAAPSPYNTLSPYPSNTNLHHMSLSPFEAGEYEGGNSATANGQGHSQNASIGSMSNSGIRDAVYIDSEEVRARLDQLLMGLAEEGVLAREQTRDGDSDEQEEVYVDAEEGVAVGADVSVDESHELETLEGLEDDDADYYASSFAPPSGASLPALAAYHHHRPSEVDYDVDPDAANALRTPPPPPPGLAGVAFASVSEAVAACGKVGVNVVAPGRQEQHPGHKAQRSQASLRSDGASSLGGSHGGHSHRGGGGSSLSSSGSLQRRQQQHAHQQSPSHQHHQRAPSQHPHPYQHAQASASQVYVGPASGSSPLSSSALAAQRSPAQAHSRAASGASSAHGGYAHSLSHSRSLSNSRGPSHSRGPSQVHSRTHSRAPSQAASRSHSRAPSVAVAAHSRGSSVAPGRSVAVGAGPNAGVAPVRPPPAPPLDVAGLELGLVGLGVEEQIGAVVEEDVRRPEMDAEEFRSGEESEEEELSEDERERLQFLRGLRLEDRMKEFGGVAFPSALDEDEEPLHRDDYDRRYHNEHGAYEERVYDHSPSRSRSPTPAMQRSMSRWSLGSSVNEPSDDTGAAGVMGKKERRKRKSFASGFGLVSGSNGGAGDVEGRGLTASPTGGSGGKEKKRGRLASFISRLSGVSGPNGLNANGSGASSAGLPPTPASPPPPPLPSPSSPSAALFPLHGLQPSPQIVEGLRKMRSEESVKSVKLQGVVAGMWEPHAAKQQQSTSIAVHNSASPVYNLAAKSVPGSPAGMMRSPALPQLSVNGAKQDTAMGGSLSTATARKLANRVVAWEEGTYTSDASDRKPTSGLRARANTSGDLLLLADGSRRPSLYKSASASLLGPSVGVQRMPLGYAQAQRRTPPKPIHTSVAPYRGGPRVVVDESLPPTPSSVASTEIEEGDEESYDDEEEEEDYGVEVHDRFRREQAHEERWARLKLVSEARQQQPLPPIPQSPPPTASGTPSAALIENTLRALGPSSSSAALQQQQPQNHHQSLIPASDTRQRLKSMPSLSPAAGSATSPPASASTTNFSLIAPPLPSSARGGKGSGFRGFVERMGLVGSSSTNSLNSSATNSPVSSSYPSTPLSAAAPLQLSIPSSSSAAVLGHFVNGSGGGSGSRSPSHSPTTSLSLVGSAYRESGGVFTPGGLLGKKKPKRKLVISGVAPENVRGYEAVKKWCENFGEVKEMTRGPNGSVYVDFKKASVAETVCCIQAQVVIKGAGSVSLSWYTKRKPL